MEVQEAAGPSDEFLNRLLEQHNLMRCYPPNEWTTGFADKTLKLLFPAHEGSCMTCLQEIEAEFKALHADLKRILDKLQTELSGEPSNIAALFMQRVPSIYEMLMLDAKAMLRGDPAASSLGEVLCAYPGFYAISLYRIAHEIHQLGVPLLPRIITEHAHRQTGIDIHPAAIIGSEFCIDHGTGVVIGETSHIGERVKLYQGVTLGALSVYKELASQKRHPSIESDVIIYSGATILGGQTVIGQGSIIGGNVWITESVPPKSRVYYQSSNTVR